MEKHLRFAASLFLLSSLLAGCAKSVPSPWKEMGVPAEHLTNVAAGSNTDHFLGEYDLAPVSAAKHLQMALTNKGFAACGDVGKLPNGEASVLLKKDGVTWVVMASGADSASVELRKLRPGIDDARTSATGCR